MYVADQQRSLDLYTQKLGFEVRRTESMGPGGKWIELAPPGAQTRPRHISTHNDARVGTAQTLGGVRL
ncbi:MAG: VOC family protein [Nitrospiraceae bacterium]